MNIDDPHELERALIRAWPPAEWHNLHVLLAVSGGSDSVALLRAVLAAKRRTGGEGRLYVAHLNHALRGDDADADEAWLHELCGRLDLPLEVGRADVTRLADEQRDGWEAAARTARYEFLRATAERLGARLVATGHTADDQVETVVHRILRGTGLAGLAGMPQVRQLSPMVSLVRPLLGIRRDEVLAYLESLGQDYRLDVTNTDRRFTRNRLRHELLPLLRCEFNADIDGAVLRLAQQAREIQQVVAELAAQLADKCVVVEQQTGVAECIRIDCRQLAGQAPVVVREVCKTAWSGAQWPLQDMGLAQWQPLAELAADRTSAASIMLPGSVHARRAGEILVLERPTHSH